MTETLKTLIMLDATYVVIDYDGTGICILGIKISVTYAGFAFKYS